MSKPDIQLHPSFGPVPPEEFDRAMKAPAMAASDIIRKYDPSFGKTDNTAAPIKFNVRVRRAVTTYEEASVEVEAGNEDDARTLVYDMDANKFHWAYEDEESPDGFHIQEIEKVES